MSARMQFYNEKFSRIEQIKWLFNLEYEILTRDPNDDDKPPYWTESDLKNIEDALLALDQMTDETYEEEKEEYLWLVYEDAYVDHMIEMELLEDLRGSNV